MRKTASAIAFSMFVAASTIGVSVISASVAEADNTQLGKCHWYKQQAFKLKTDAAWKKYHDCMRGRLW